MRLEDIVEDIKLTCIDTIFVAASNGVSCHYVNGVRTLFGSNTWTLSAVDPKTGNILGAKTLSKDDPVALVKAIDEFTNGSVIVLAYSGLKPVEIGPVLANTINESIRHQGLPQNAYKNLVLVGYKLRKPRGFYSASLDGTSLMVTCN